MRGGFSTRDAGVGQALSKEYPLVLYVAEGSESGACALGSVVLWSGGSFNIVAGARGCEGAKAQFGKAMDGCKKRWLRSNY